MSQTSLLRFLWADGEIRHAAEPEKTPVGWSVHRLASGDCCLVGRTATSSSFRWSSFVVSRCCDGGCYHRERAQQPSCRRTRR